MFKKIKYIYKIVIQNIIKFVQKILITIFLFLLYFIFFGITLIFILIFKKNMLKQNYESEYTFWNKAKDYNADIKESIHQS
jgi:hypothetical protein